jgi:hypothetical protein
MTKIQEFLKAVFSVGAVPRLYKEETTDLQPVASSSVE